MCGVNKLQRWLFVADLQNFTFPDVTNTGSEDECAVILEFPLDPRVCLHYWCGTVTSCERSVWKERKTKADAVRATMRSIRWCHTLVPPSLAPQCVYIVCYRVSHSQTVLTHHDNLQIPLTNEALSGKRSVKTFLSSSLRQFSSASPLSLFPQVIDLSSDIFPYRI